KGATKLAYLFFLFLLRFRLLHHLTHFTLETIFFFRLFLILLNLIMYLILIYDIILNHKHYNNCNQVRNEVIQTQSTSIVIKEKQHHYRRDVNHDFHDAAHIRHPFLSRLLHSLLLTSSHFHVKENCNRGQDRKQTNVVSIERYAEPIREFVNNIIRRKIICP